jgi:hypothetical protein
MEAKFELHVIGQVIYPECRCTERIRSRYAENVVQLIWLLLPVCVLDTIGSDWLAYVRWACSAFLRHPCHIHRL